MQTIDPLQIGQTVREVLQRDREAEYSARSLYTEARTASANHRDFVPMKLRFAASATTATFVAVSETVLESGDILIVIAPATPGCELGRHRLHVT